MNTKAHTLYLHMFAAAALVGLPLGLFILCGAPAPQRAQPRPYTTWPAFGGSKDSMQYSALRQINKTNVTQLEQVWFYPAPGREPLGRFAFNPLVVDGVMYLAGRDCQSIVALDAATGKEIWNHPTVGNPNVRGLAYWESKDRSDRRIIFSLNQPYNAALTEVDARTGAPIKSFGQDGLVDLRVGLGRDPKTVRRVQSGMPGHVFENLIIIGSDVNEGYDDPPGYLRAYDVITGENVWTFHTVPHPGEFGYDTWPPDAWKYTGGTNTWASFSIDEKRGIGYFPIGSPTYDMYGARRKGMNLFGDCLLALDLRTGKRVWHYQVIHHDLWDYDPCNEPKLLTVNHDGKKVDIVAMGTKSGFLFVFNRVTGEPLWPIEERPVPKSDVPGEEAWPTQPFPTKPPAFSRQRMTADDINPYLEPAEREKLRKIFLAARHEGVYTPMSDKRDQISLPGEHGGTNWGGTAGDPETGMLYVRAENYAAIHHLFERTPPRAFRGGTPEQQGRVLWAQLCESCHGPDETGVKTIQERSPERLQTIIRGGVGRMEGVGYSDLTLNEPNMKRLLAYIANPVAGAGEPPAPAGRGGRPMAPPGPLPNGETRRYFGQFGNWWRASNGLRAISPPWAELVAYDLNEGTIKWRVPLGTAPSLVAKGIKDTGAFVVVQNGPVVTGGGLIFMGTEADRTLRAYDKDTGKTLWEKEMESNPKSIPAVYEVGGRQYISFFCISRAVGDAAHKAGKPEAQGYYAFGLPRAAMVSKK